SGPAEPPARKPSGVSSTVVIRSATPPLASVATGCALHDRPSADVHASGAWPDRPTATAPPCPSDGTATGKVNSVLPMSRSVQVVASSEVHATGCQRGYT